MTIYLRQATANQEIPLGIFVSATDGNSEQAALTINASDIKLWQNGATTLASKNSGGATYISNGIYYCVLDATDTATLGSLVIFIHVSGALAVKVECVVLTANVYDSLILGSDLLDTYVPAYTAPDNSSISAIKTKTDQLAFTGALVNAQAKGLDADVITSSALAASAVSEIVAGLLAGVVEGTITVQQALMIVNAALAGKADGGAGTTMHFRNIADTKNRVTATVDPDGNRSAVTLDFT